MSWLYWQTWLWYLLAFVIGVLLARQLFVVPQLRRLSGLDGNRQPRGDRETVPGGNRTGGRVTAAAAGGIATVEEAEAAGFRRWDSRKK